MQEVFEKIIEKLEEEKKSELGREDLCDEEGYGDGEEIYEDGKSAGRYEQTVRIIEIVKQAAEGFGTDTNVGSNGWISCSERLPENVDHLADGDKKKQYLVMTRNGRYEVAEWLEVYDKPFWCGHYSQEIKDVIRWKPLEPYQPKGE